MAYPSAGQFGALAAFKTTVLLLDDNFVVSGRDA